MNVATFERSLDRAHPQDEFLYSFPASDMLWSAERAEALAALSELSFERLEGVNQVLVRCMEARTSAASAVASSINDRLCLIVADSARSATSGLATNVLDVLATETRAGVMHPADLELELSAGHEPVRIRGLRGRVSEVREAPKIVGLSDGDIDMIIDGW